jgi:hypothetical protein
MKIGQLQKDSLSLSRQAHNWVAGFSYPPLHESQHKAVHLPPGILVHFLLLNLITSHSSAISYQFIYIGKYKCEILMR